MEQVDTVVQTRWTVACDKMNIKCWVASTSHGFGTDIQNEGISLNIFFDGCSHEPHCNGCHNPMLWTQDDSSECTVEDVNRVIGLNSDIVTHVAFMGGEPVDQARALFYINRYAKSIGLKTWLYTGFEYKHIPRNLQTEFNVIVSGRYDETQKQDGFPASKNQVVTVINEN